MKRHHSEHLDSDSEGEDYDSAECSSPDAAQVSSRKKRRGIIEKRRRDRINNCLAELKRLVPAAFEKQGSAKLEKAEILQMTVDHLKHLHQARDPRADTCTPYGNTRAFLDYRLMGFREALAEVARYMVSVEGMDAKDPLRLRVLNHLENYLAQRELAINAAIAASTHKTQATVNALFPAQPLPGFIPPQMTTPLNKDYVMAQKFMSFAPTTAAPMPPFHIPVSTMTPLAFHPALGVTSIPVAMPTSAATKVESPTPSSPASGYKSPGSASSPRAPFRPWLTDDKMT